MPIVIPKLGNVNAFAIIVDINGFTKLVTKSEGNLIAQFVRDVLSGSIKSIEHEGGEVVGFMGDAILGVIGDIDSAAKACFGIADDLNSQCEFFSNEQTECPDLWDFAPGGPSLKIGIEYGRLDISTIESRALGTQRLLIGDAINYAARILAAGSGNRCLIGPAARSAGFGDFGLDGPHQVAGKHGEPEYEYYQFVLGDVWIEGSERPDSYW